MNLRAAIYARFSGTLQNPQSIEDQVRLCRDKVRHLGSVVVRVYSDPASTGATKHFRPGLRRLLNDVTCGLIDLVCTEALDRISRDLEDMAGIFKRLSFRNVRLVTLEEGEIDSIHVTVHGYLNHAWSNNLASKTRRGQIGTVYSGRIPAGLCYGYLMANRIDEHGQAIRGLRKIHPEQADIVRRIFRLYADGKSAREIAFDFNRLRTPGPRGKPWGATTINGNCKLRNGILNNELYRGRLVYGRQRFVRDPDTGKRQARPVPDSEWTIQELPNLRIVDEDLWRRVQERREAGEDRRKNPMPKTPLPLTGLVRCAQCGANMNIVRNRRYACKARREQGTCDNPRGIDPVRLENQVCALLAEHITAKCRLPDLLRHAAEEIAHRRQRLEAAIADAKQRIAGLLDEIEQGSQSQAAYRRILILESETVTIKRELDSLPIPRRRPERLAARLQDRLAILNGVIANAQLGTQRRTNTLLLARGLIERIDIAPLPGRGRMNIVIQPCTDALVAFAFQEKWDPAAQEAGDRA